MTYSPGAINTDKSSTHHAHVSHFGVLKAGTTIPVIKGNFPGSTLNTTIWTESSSNSASITVSDGMGHLISGTNSAGSTSLRSRRKGRFEAGQVSVFQSGVRAGTGIAGNTRIWGMRTSDGQDGLYFKLDGATFKVVAKKGGTETEVESSSFSGDTTFVPQDKNTTYRIEYSAGRAIFYSASGGKKNLLHEMVDTAAPLVNDLDMGIYYENTNSGNTTSKTMYIRGASISVWGDLRRFNEGGAQVTADFGTEVARGVVDGYEIKTKFGRNPDIDTASTPEDLWAGGSLYTGFNATANENIEVFSSDANDQGLVVSSGTATGGSTNTLIDSGATFVTDGAAAGDLLINDTTQSHGSIVSVDSETQVTVFRMNNSVNRDVFNVNGDSYRIVNANDTGAAVVRLEFLLDEDYVEQDHAYVVLNGVTGVTVTGNYMRCSRAKVIHAGSSGNNEGTLTIRQATTTANVFAQLPSGIGQTTIGAFTVPNGKMMILKRIRVNLTRANGSAGSATVNFNVRPKGQAWRAVRVFDLQTGSPTEFTQLGGEMFHEGTDVKYTIINVSDNNTIVDGAFEYFLVDE